MKMLKIVGLLLVIAVFMPRPAFADYTLDLKNDAGTVIKTYTITTNQVAHLQKHATNRNITILSLFETAIRRLITSAKVDTKSSWIMNNESYIEEQSRQP